MSLLAILSLGFFLGMRHATDADHLVAVSAIVTGARTKRSALAVGALWGIGHTLTIFAVGGAIVGLGVVISPELGLSLEMCVAAMLVILGIMNLSGVFQRFPKQVENGTLTNSAVQPSKWLSLRPLFVGIVHGMAGSAAVALLVLATVRNPLWALLYLGIFGLGTIAGMALLTLAMALPLLALAKYFGPLEARLGRLTGLVSIAFGLFLAYRVGVVDGLLTGVPHWSPE